MNDIEHCRREVCHCHRVIRIFWGALIFRDVCPDSKLAHSSGQILRDVSALRYVRYSFECKQDELTHVHRDEFEDSVLGQNTDDYFSACLGILVDKRQTPRVRSYQKPTSVVERTKRMDGKEGWWWNGKRFLDICQRWSVWHKG